jgi:hypothetical protein
MLHLSLVLRERGHRDKYIPPTITFAVATHN